MPISPAALLLRSLELAFDKRAWHGTTLLGSLRGLDAESASWKPGPGRHSIHDLVVHCAYWKYVVRRRLTGGRRGSFYRSGSNFFPTSPEQWKGDVSALKREHLELLQAVRALTLVQLDVTPPGSTFNVRDTVLGAASHDLYHAGQIQLLKRLRR